MFFVENIFNKSRIRVILMQSKVSLARIIMFISIILLVCLNQNDSLHGFVDDEFGYFYSQEDSVVIDSLFTSVDIVNSKEILVSETIEIRNNQDISISYLEFELIQLFSNFTVRDSDGQLDFEIEEGTNLFNVTFRENLLANATKYLFFNYNLDIELQPVSNDPLYYYFQFEKLFYYYTYSHRISLRLPVDCEIHDFEFQPNSFYPSDAILTKTGNRYYLDWEFENLEAMSTNLIFVFYEKEVDTRIPTYWFVLGPILGIIFGGATVFLFMIRRENLNRSRMEMVYLSDNQKLLLKILDEKDMKIQQKELQNLTGFTKSKISRNLTPLIEKGLVEKEKWGREYIVRITTDGKKVLK